MHLSSLISAHAIITHLNAFNTNYIISTTRVNNQADQYRSVIKVKDHSITLYDLCASNTQEAAIQHAALFNLAEHHTVFRWNQKVLNFEGLQLLVNDLRQQSVLPRADTLNSTFTRKLFKAAGLAQIQSEFEASLPKLAGVIVASLVAMLSLDWIMDWYYR